MNLRLRYDKATLLNAAVHRTHLDACSPSDPMSSLLVNGHYQLGRRRRYSIESPGISFFLKQPASEKDMRVKATTQVLGQQLP
jgi:hypothetical protein